MHPYIIYDKRDFDGIASASLFLQKYDSAILVPYDYSGSALNLESGIPIFILDLALPIQQVKELSELCGGSLTWIDHHVKTIRNYTSYIEENKPFCTLIHEEGKSTIDLTWEFLHGSKPMPNGLKLLSDFDCWRNSDQQYWHNQILPFQYGLYSICTSPLDFPKELLKNNAERQIADLITAGSFIQDYLTNQYRLNCEKAFPISFATYRAIALNTSFKGSTQFESVYNPQLHDLMLTFSFDGNSWQCYIYTTKDDVDCQALASAWGGGGHTKAAGFSTTDIQKIISKRLIP